MKITFKFKDHNDLCSSCIYLQVAKGQSGMVLRTCAQLRFIEWPYSDRIPEPIEECNQYKKANSLTLRQMEKIAWVIETKGKGQIGFVRASEWNENHKKESLIPWDHPLTQND